jgi:hypothetical protein
MPKINLFPFPLKMTRSLNSKSKSFWKAAMFWILMLASSIYLQLETLLPKSIKKMSKLHNCLFGLENLSGLQNKHFLKRVSAKN